MANCLWAEPNANELKQTTGLINIWFGAPMSERLNEAFEVITIIVANKVQNEQIKYYTQRATKETSFILDSKDPEMFVQYWDSSENGT